MFEIKEVQGKKKNEISLITLKDLKISKAYQTNKHIVGKNRIEKTLIRKEKRKDSQFTPESKQHSKLSQKFTNQFVQDLQLNLTGIAKTY